MALTVVIGPTIQAGESLSDGLDLTAGDLLRLTMPLEWDDAPLTFQISTDGVNYNDCYHIDGYEVVVPVVVPRSAVIVPLDVGKAIAWIKFRSGTGSDPVVQSEVRTFAVAISTYVGGSGPKP
jgi:hypothetical protein